MKAFLRQVAAHYWGPDIQDTVFVFPNRRSMVFFRKYLSEEVAAHSPSPILSPRLYTVNDFFYRVYDVDVTDRITLILSLYEVYRSLYPQAEPLDEFVFWGDVILSDFDDVDKYLADPKMNIARKRTIVMVSDTFFIRKFFILLIMQPPPFFPSFLRISCLPKP